MPCISESGEPRLSRVLWRPKLGVLVTGGFQSYCRSRVTLALEKFDVEDQQSDSGESTDDETTEVIESVIENHQSLQDWVIFSSNDFVRSNFDGGLLSCTFLNSPQMIVNFVDWALEDESLTSIRKG